MKESVRRVWRTALAMTLTFGALVQLVLFALALRSWVLDLTVDSRRSMGVNYGTHALWRRSRQDAYNPGHSMNTGC